MILGEKERVTNTHVYFLKGPLSQWYPSEFCGNDPITSMLGWTGRIHKYVNCEQWMMHGKALFMKDFETAKLIMEATKPSVIKDLGREVKNYDEELWSKVRFAVVTFGNHLKFHSDGNLEKFLESTGNHIIVEAAYYDSIWGVKLAQDDDRILDENNWQGQNLLGKALMTVRDNFQQWRDTELEKLVKEVVNPFANTLRT